MVKIVGEWDANFIDIGDTNLLLRITNAAHYLDIAPLVDLCCAKLCCMVHGQTAEDIPGLFGVTTPFTAEEEAQIDHQYPWLQKSKLPYSECVEGGIDLEE